MGSDLGMSITENVLAVKKSIADKCAQLGLEPGSVRLCAATKMNDAARVREAVEAGVDICGENRVQELTEKLEQGAYEGCPLHFIGHLQKNKVKFVVGTAALIHSVDSVELAEKIDAAAKKLGSYVIPINGGIDIPEAGIRISGEIIENCKQIDNIHNFDFKYSGICGSISLTPRQDGDRIRLRGRGCTKSRHSGSGIRS